MPELFREVAAYQLRCGAGLLASGSIYWPRLPARSSSGDYAAFVPGYSSATATDSHRASLGPRAMKRAIWVYPLLSVQVSVTIRRLALAVKEAAMSKHS